MGHRRPQDKRDLLTGADDAVTAIDKQFQRGLITEDERYEQVVELWQRTTKEVSDPMMPASDRQRRCRMMTHSGARGNKGNIGQLGAMRGLMADPSGRIIDLPVRSNFREGMTRPRVLHLDPRRAQGPRRHRAPHRGLRVPHPAAG